MAAKPMFQTVVLAVACLMATHVTAADDLEKQLLKNSKPILEAVRAKGYRNVGVIKFRIKSGDGPATDRLGTMNLRLAEKLELALILANKLSDPIGIIRNANATAAKIPDASHLTPEGRAKLFSKDYPLAWGKTRVVPDAFLTGRRRSRPICGR